MIYARPGTAFTALLDDAETGLEGTLEVRVKRTDGSTVIGPTTEGITEIEAGSGAYSKTFSTAPSIQGTYIILWDVAGEDVAVEELIVTFTLPIPGVGGGLVSLQEMKVALNLLDTTEQDEKILQAIPEAEAAIFNTTNRTFEVTPPSASAVPRTFEYSDSGVIEIADAQHGTIESVTAGGRLLLPDEWSAEPSAEEYPVTWWIELAIPGSRGLRSPEMGFTRNEDVLWREGRLRPVADSDVVVTAVWGWPAVPLDVRRAAIWTVAAFMERPTPYVSESIAGYSRTSPNPLTVAIPARARALLDYHVKGGGD